MLKKFILLFSFLALGVFFYFKGRQAPPVVNASHGWEKFSKNTKEKGDQVTFTNAKKSDLEKHQLPVVKRRPASKPVTNHPMRSGRFLEGQNAFKYTAPTERLKIKNKVSSSWKKRLAHNLVRFHEEGTEVLIKKERGLIFLHQGAGEYREQVLISYKLPDGKKSSFRAMVNSDTGKVIYTYDRTINEDFRKKPAGLSHPLVQ